MADTSTSMITLALSAGTGTTGAHANRALITDAATGALVLNAAEFADAFRIGGTASGTFQQNGVAIVFTAADGHTADALTHTVAFTGSNGVYGYAFRVDTPSTTNGANASLAAALTDGSYTVQAVTQDANGTVVQAPAQSLIVDTTADAAAPATLVVNDTADHVVTPAEATGVAFTVAGLDGDATALATFTDGTHTQTKSVAANGSYTVDLSGFTGSVQSSLVITDVHQNTASVTGTTVAFAASGSAIGTPATGVDLTHQSLFGTVEHSVTSNAAGVYALYEALLGRAPDALGLETFGHQPLTTVAQALLASPEHGAGAQSPTAFVQGLYTNLLHRDADASGLATFTGELNAGVSQAQVAVQLATSAEAQSVTAPAFQTGVFVPDGVDASVARLYYGLLDRAPDSGGLSGFSGLIEGNILTNRIPGYGLNGAQSLQLVAERILTSPEYQQAHAGQTDTAFVTSLYAGALGRAPDAGGQAAYLDQLAHGVSRATVALEIAESPEAQVHLVGVIEQGFHLAG